MPENVTNLTGEKPDTYDPNLHANEAMDAAIAELERLDGNGHVVAQLLEAREAIRANYRQRNGDPGGDQADTTDAAVAQRVKAVLGEAEFDLCQYLLTGRKVGGLLRSALDDAEQAGIMLGCALAGSETYFGGTPADHVVADWTFLHERKMKLAKALADRATEGGGHE